VYYLTHQFFITDRAIYLILFNLREPQQNWKLIYWLNSVYTRSKDVTMIVIGTHTDCVSPEYLEEVRDAITTDELLNAFKFLGPFFASSFTGKGIDEIRQQIVKAAVKSKYVMENIPKTFLLMETFVELQKMKVKDPPVMTFQELKQGCLEAQINPDNILATAKYLNEIGAIVHFNDPRANLNNLIILDPQWLSNVS
jgi:hypothetical protein